MGKPSDRSRTKIEKVTELMLMAEAIEYMDRFVRNQWPHLSDEERDQIRKEIGELQDELQGRRPPVKGSGLFQIYRKAASKLANEKQAEASRYILQRLTKIPDVFYGYSDEIVDLMRGPWTKNIKPRTWTPELLAEARELYAELHPRIRAARTYCTRNHQLTGESAAREDLKLHGKGSREMPESVVAELPLKIKSPHDPTLVIKNPKSPEAVTYDWIALELKQRHPDLTDLSGGGIRKKLARSRQQSRAAIDGDTRLQQTLGIAP